jgi:hypothetical protein
MLPTVPLPPWTLFTDQLTAALKPPVPETVAEQGVVWLVGTVLVAQKIVTEVIAGDGEDVFPLGAFPPPQPTAHNNPRKEK